MNPLLAVALGWAKDHWRDVGCGLALVLAFLYVRQSGELSACLTAASLAKVDLTQQQGVSATAQTEVRLVAGPPRACPPNGQCPPCPEAVVISSATGNGQQVQEAHLAPVPAPVQQGSIWIGAGYPAHAMIGIDYGRAGAYGTYDVTGNWTVGGKWAALKF